MVWSRCTPVLLKLCKYSLETLPSMRQLPLWPERLQIRYRFKNPGGPYVTKKFSSQFTSRWTVSDLRIIWWYRKLQQEEWKVRRIQQVGEHNNKFPLATEISLQPNMALHLTICKEVNRNILQPWRGEVSPPLKKQRAKTIQNCTKMICQTRASSHSQKFWGLKTPMFRKWWGSRHTPLGS